MPQEKRTIRNKVTASAPLAQKDVFKRLAVIAKEQDRSFNNVIIRAILQYLEQEDA